MTGNTKPKIIIVGAGISGIAAATKLLENGYSDITILEAENRIGGRIHSVEFEGKIVDLGGTWVHGVKGNVVYEMLKDLDLLNPPKLSQDPEISFFRLDGSQPDKNITNRLFAIALAVKDDEECAKQHTGKFADYFRSEYNRRVQLLFKSNEEVLHLAKLVEQWFQKSIVLLNAAESWEKLSTTSQYIFKPCEGDPMIGWKSKGFRTIFDVMTKKIPDPSKQLPLDEKVLLNKEVSQILWDQQSDGQVTVKCSDGSVYNADHVIVTVPVGVLKSVYKNMFVPPLPEKTINSIENVPVGTINKILLKFPTKWWPDTLKEISFLWSDEEREQLLKDVNRGPEANGRSWLENLFSFITLHSHPNILLGWVNGPTANLVDQLSDEIVIEGAMYMLRKFAGKRFEIPEPDSMIRSKWSANPHFQGSYSYASDEMERHNASTQDLSIPLTARGKPVVLFAGEATHPYLFSTVNGAMETGYREADRIFKFYQK